MKAHHAVSRVLMAGFFAVLLAYGSAVPAWGYCIIRDTGGLEVPEGSDQWVTQCCSGNPRIWRPEDQPVQEWISDNSPEEVWADVQNALTAWTDIPSSTFSFEYAGTTDIVESANDDYNVVGFDPQYCTRRNNCGEGVQASSGCNTSTEGYYHATDCDIFFNAEEKTWGHDPGEADPSGTCLHELGHNVGTTHPSNTPRRGGSAGCGYDSGAATMWYRVHTGDGTLELDDVAAATAIYPAWRFTVEVVDLAGNPLSAAAVWMDHTCFPHDGSSYTDGGMVLGDIPECLVGDGTDSATYFPNSTYVTGQDGKTGAFRVLHNYFCITVVKENYETATGCFTLPKPGDYVTTVRLQESFCHNMDCDDGYYCNGTELCNDAEDVCEPSSGNPCGPFRYCDEGAYGGCSPYWVENVLLFPWITHVRTNIFVERGQPLETIASGRVRLSDDAREIGPAGIVGSACGAGCALPEAPAGALLGRIVSAAASNAPFVLGERFSGMAPAWGTLEVFVNDADGQYEDNTGIFSVGLQYTDSAIELVSFTATGGTDRVTLAWVTSREEALAGFHLWRSDAQDGDYERITADLIPSEGNESTGAEYSFVDTDVVPGTTYWYQLANIDLGGNTAFNGPASATVPRKPHFGCGMAGGTDGSLAGLLVLLGLALIRRAGRRT